MAQYLIEPHAETESTSNIRFASETDERVFSEVGLLPAATS